MPDRYPPDEPLSHRDMDDIRAHMGPVASGFMSYVQAEWPAAEADNDQASLGVLCTLGGMILREEARKLNETMATAAASRADTATSASQNLSPPILAQHTGNNQSEPARSTSAQPSNTFTIRPQSNNSTNRPPSNETPTPSRDSTQG